MWFGEEARLAGTLMPASSSTTNSVPTAYQQQRGGGHDVTSRLQCSNVACCAVIQCTKSRQRQGLTAAAAVVVVCLLCVCVTSQVTPTASSACSPSPTEKCERGGQMCDGVWVQLQWSAVQVLLTAQQHAWLAAAVAATVVRRCRGWLCNPACL